MPPFLKGNLNFSITFFNISSDTFLFALFLKKCPKNCFFKFCILAHSYSNCPTGLKFAFFLECYQIFIIYIFLFIYIPKYFINKPNFNVNTPKLRIFDYKKAPSFTLKMPLNKKFALKKNI